MTRKVREKKYLIVLFVQLLVFLGNLNGVLLEALVCLSDLIHQSIIWKCS